MAEWLMRSTVNTFFRGSIPFDAFLIKISKIFKFKRKYNVKLYKANMLKLVNNLFLSRSGSNSLRVQVSLFVLFFQR